MTQTPSRVMALTPELVALCHRVVEDQGPVPGAVPMGDGDFAPAAADILSRKPAGPLQLFAYGSLIWKPEVPHVRMRRARADGWHRAFSMEIRRFRATVDQPGYMMCLDRGGVCEGVVLQLPEAEPQQQIEKLLRRELSRKVALEAVRWITVETAEGPLTALAFYAGPAALDNYKPGLSARDIAPILARACGHWGSGADYLYNTVRHLEDQGIHDKGLWDLQEAVAQEIRKLYRVSD
ncbi:MAG: gamma-glutamylcyclotransferase [Hyphomicrobiales bacterium]